MYRLKGITGFHYLSLELESEANLHKPSLYCHRVRAFQILTCRPVILHSPDVPSSHVVTRTFRKPYRNCISFGLVSNISHAEMLNAHPKIFCFRVLGLFSSFGFVSNIPRTHHDFLFSIFCFLIPSFGFVSNIAHTHHDALRPSHDFLFPNVGFELARL